MRPIQLLLLAIATIGLTEARNRGNGNGNGNGNTASTTSTAAQASDSATASTGAGLSATCNPGDPALVLDCANQQAASESAGGAVAEAGQSDSQTDKANFINFCSGKTITNGQQVTGGSCNGIVMGDIPSSANMISAVITSPNFNTVNLQPNTDFQISVQVQGLQPGTFTNPKTTYYGAPQALNGAGQIIGHTHVTVQDLNGDINTSTPPDPTKFVFFKGINDAGNGNGLLSATVTGGLPAGAYRVCSMTSAANHQPVLMPLAQRGAQDDCKYFTISSNGNAKAIASSSTGASAGASTTTANNNGNGNSNGNGNGNSNNNGNGNAASSTTSAASSIATGADNGNGTTNTGNGGNGRNGHRHGGRRGRYSARDFVA